MPVVEFSQKDILRSKIVSPAWYRVRIDSTGEGPSKDGGSTNYPIEGTILFNGDTGDTEYSGVPLNWNFNSKAIGFAVGYLAAFGVEVKAGTRFDLKASEGKELDVFVETGMYNGNQKNQVNHKYRQPKPDVQAVGV